MMLNRRSAMWLGGLALAGAAGRLAAQAPAGGGVSLRLGAREGDGVPTKHGCAQTGGGNIDVRQTAPDTMVVTLAGTAAADGSPFCDSGAHFDFDLSQCFLVVFDKPGLEKANLYVQGRAIGLLRGGEKGSAGLRVASAAVGPEGVAGSEPLASFCLPTRSVGPGENRTVNLAGAPAWGPVLPGPFALHLKLGLDAAHPKCVPCKPAVAEFAPGPAVAPVWLGQKEPFYGAAKKDFGFQVILKVAPASADPVAVLQAMSQQAAQPE